MDKTDLTNCDREPIHIPGSVQPHVALLALENGTGKLLYASANLPAFLGLALRWDAPWSHWRPGDAGAWPSIEAVAPADFERPGTSWIQLANRRLRILSHHSENLHLIELEEERAAETPDIGGALERMAGLRTLSELLDRATEELQQITGCDRVVAYQFNADGDGEVVAERRVADMDPYLGLHFPESDIPRQARELYSRQWIRCIPDARYRPVPVEAAPGVVEPLDLSCALGRSVSPLHLEYMANMGLQASMSVSLIVEGKLWGLLSCGHRTPKAFPHLTRRASETLGRVLSVQIEAIETRAFQTEVASRRDALQQLSAAMGQGQPHVLHGLVGQAQQALALARADGFAVVVDGSPVVVGTCPSADTLVRIADIVAQRAAENGRYETRQLGWDISEFADSAETASGVLAFRMPAPVQAVAIWCRREVIHTVEWGGNPAKQVVQSADGMARLHPRRSFSLWREQVKGQSLPWTEADRHLVAELRREAVEVDLIRQVDRERAAVRARDDLVAVVSHDLRTPISVIGMQATLIQRLLAQEDINATHRLYASTLVIQRSSDRMRALLNDLLDLARIEAGRFNVSPVRQPLQLLLQDGYELLSPAAHGAQVELEIASIPALHVLADPERVFQVLSNLIGNAIKFTPAGGRVQVTAEPCDGMARVCITDSGPGIPADQLPRVFDRYWQAKEADSLGAGLGLYIAKGIVEAHGGVIDASNVAGGGASFGFTLPLAAS